MLSVFGTFLYIYYYNTFVILPILILVFKTCVFSLFWDIQVCGCVRIPAASTLTATLVFLWAWCSSYMLFIITCVRLLSLVHLLRERRLPAGLHIHFIRCPSCQGGASCVHWCFTCWASKEDHSLFDLVAQSVSRSHNILTKTCH